MNWPIRPAISVVLPTYQRNRLLKIALKSVEAQTFRDFEVIVCDDADSPQTRSLVESLKDQRFRYVGNRSRLGMLRNNLSGFRLAEAPLIANLHDDDRWAPEFLNRLSRPLLDDLEISIAFCDQNVIDEAGQRRADLASKLSLRYGRAELQDGKYDRPYSLVVHQTIPAVAGSIFRKCVVDFSEFDESVGPAYDLWLSYLATKKGSAYFVKEFLVDYRIHSNSQTGIGGIAWSTGSAYCWRMISEDPDYASWAAFSRRRMSAGYSQAAATLIETRDASQARQYAFKGFLASPQWRSAAILFATMLPSGIARALRQGWRMRHQRRLSRLPTK